MTARWITSDVFDGLATLDDASVDLVITSPPFLALRSYLPADHPDKGKEIGSEPTPAAFIDVMLAVTAELRRVLAPHGSIAIELGDTYSGSGESGWERDKGEYRRENRSAASANGQLEQRRDLSNGWPLAKSKTLIPELYRLALAYGINPLTGKESPAGRWRVRNVVTWCRPNPPVGALGDKWRPATSDIVIACTSDKRYWDDIATRKEYKPGQSGAALRVHSKMRTDPEFTGRSSGVGDSDYTNGAGAPLLDYWELPPGGYPGSHYAVYPPALVEPLIKAMAPPKVCTICGEPSRRIHHSGSGLGRIIQEARTAQGLSRRDLVPLFVGHYKNEDSVLAQISNWELDKNVPMSLDWDLLKQRLNLGNEWDHLLPDRDAVSHSLVSESPSGWTQDATGRVYQRLPARMDRHVKEGWSDCGHDNYRPAHILDPFAGSGTTLAVATGHGHEATGIDLDERNRDLALERIGPFLFEEATT